MNARGKRLSRYDTFKSDLESALEKKQKNDAETETVDKWKQEIDNSILDGYFERFGAKYAERNLFRTILFYCKALTAMQKKAYNDSWEKDEKDANYQDEIALLQGDSSALRDLTTALSAFPNWYSVLKGNISRDAFYLKNFLSTEAFFFEHEDGLRGERTLNAKVRLFGVLYWFSKGLAGGEHFEQYARIVKNYLDSLRTPNNRPTRHYEFKVRGDSVWDTFRFLKNLVDRYLEKKDGCTDFYDYVKKTGEEALAFERDKLNSPDFSKILGLERLPYLGANIGNLFFDGRVHLDREEIQKLFKEELCDTDAKLFPPQLPPSAIPQDFSELIRLYGLVYGTGTWEANERQLADPEDPYRDVLVLREDVQRALYRHGVRYPVVPLIANEVGKGNWAKNGYPTEARKREHGFSDEDFARFGKIRFLFPKAHAVGAILLRLYLQRCRDAYPVEYFAAALTGKAKRETDASCFSSNREQIAGALDGCADERKKAVLKTALACMDREIEFLPADPNVSDPEAFLPGKGTIRLPLRLAEKGIAVPPFFRSPCRRDPYGGRLRAGRRNRGRADLRTGRAVSGAVRGIVSDRRRTQSGQNRAASYPCRGACRFGDAGVLLFFGARYGTRRRALEVLARHGRRPFADPRCDRTDRPGNPASHGKTRDPGRRAAAGQT